MNTRAARQSTQRSLKDIGEAISAHLKRFEADKVINAPRVSHRGMTPFYNAGTCVTGGWLAIVYISYQGRCRSMRRPAAEAYLAWLDAGNVGTHFKQQRQAEKASTS